MFEIFLFINPIGIYCYDTETQIRNTVNELGIDVSYHYVPITNVCIVKDDVIRRRKNAQKLTDISEFSEVASTALETFHAIRLAYGNKKARCYLYELQKKLSHDTSNYSSQLLHDIAKKLQINCKTINALKKSTYLKTSIEEDQKLAQQWNIRETPTVVLFNEANEQNGVLLEGPIDQADLCDLLTPDRQTYSASCLSACHLHLI